MDEAKEKDGARKRTRTMSSGGSELEEEKEKGGAQAESNGRMGIGQGPSSGSGASMDRWVRKGGGRWTEVCRIWSVDSRRTLYECVGKTAGVSPNK